MQDKFEGGILTILSNQSTNQSIVFKLSQHLIELFSFKGDSHYSK